MKMLTIRNISMTGPEPPPDAARNQWKGSFQPLSFIFVATLSRATTSIARLLKGFVADDGLHIVLCRPSPGAVKIIAASSTALASPPLFRCLLRAAMAREILRESKG